ncbi:MAG TPA: SDR family oxidoreductase [Streptosporangiaceae bacterium]|nr:SDR family oxidoreductase [Streptosporangiaceae bacterium]
MSVTVEVLAVTGGASGIGRAVAELAAAEGIKVAVLDLPGPVEAAVSEITASGARQVIAVGCDVTDEEQVAQAFARIADELGPVDGLVCAAGIDRGGFVHELPYKLWRQVLATNLDGTFLCMQRALAQMMEQGRGSIVCCSSPASFVGFAAGGASAYSASKGAVSALVRTAAVDYARYQIRVNALVPGSTETTLMWANVPEAERPAMREVLAREIPLGRLAEPPEPARAALWLLSDDAAYVTGSHLVIDGGTLAKGSVSV